MARQITISTMEESVLRVIWAQLPEMRRRDENGPQLGCLCPDDWDRLERFLAREIGRKAV